MDTAGVERWLSDHARVLDLAFAAVVTVAAQFQVPTDTALWVRLGLFVATAVLALRRIRPLPAACIQAVAVGSMGFSTAPPSVFAEYVAVLVMAYTVAEQLPIREALAGGAVLVLGIVAHDWQSPEYGGLAGFVSDTAMPAVLWGLGRVVRLQRRRTVASDRHAAAVEARRQEEVSRAIAEERRHLARELHDVVTHSLSMVVIQAEAAQRVLGSGHEDQVRGGLVAIEEASRAALADMRGLLGLLRSADDDQALGPQPVLTDVEGLVEGVRAVGQPVELTCVGPVAAVSAGVGVSAYRIVQEALTNALRYAPGAPTRVRLEVRPEAVEVVVEDHGPGVADPSVSVSGRGLLGMRERVAVYGGSLEAAPAEGGGFRVRAVLPLPASGSAVTASAGATADDLAESRPGRA